MTPYRPHTPILIVLLIIAILVAAVSVLADHIDEIAIIRLQPLVAAALVAAGGGTRIFIR